MTSRPARTAGGRFADFCHDHPRPAAILSALLSKISKHLALLACLIIVGKAAGRFTIGEPGIFLLTIFATMAHLCGRALSPPLPAGPFKTLP